MPDTRLASGTGGIAPRRKIPKSVPLSGLRALRTARNVSARDLARTLDVSTQLIYCWEALGKSTSVGMLCAIADALGCTTDAILGRAAR